MYSFKSSTSVQSFIRTPSCQVCLESFDESQHVPKILQCAHTVCEGCINVLEDQGRRGNNRSSVDRSLVHISCPVCRTITQTPRSYIRTNYQLIDVVDAIRGEANHNIAFVTCIDCKGVYHEKDINICTKCAPASEHSCAAELIKQGVCLDEFAVCSTCILKEHISNGHLFVRLQPLRVEMQRQENLRRMVSLQDKLHQVQHGFRQRLDQTMDKWIAWSGSSELNMKMFQEATDSFHQQKVYEEFVKELTKKTEYMEKLSVHLQRWNDELDRNMAPTQEPSSRQGTPIPPRQSIPPPLDPFISEYLNHYFEQ